MVPYTVLVWIKPPPKTIDWFESFDTNLDEEIGKLFIPGNGPLFFGLASILEVVLTKTPTDK